MKIKIKYVVKHKSAKLLITYAVGKLEAALNISQLILSTSNPGKCSLATKGLATKKRR